MIFYSSLYKHLDFISFENVIIHHYTEFRMRKLKLEICNIFLTHHWNIYIFVFLSFEEVTKDKN